MEKPIIGGSPDDKESVKDTLIDRAASGKEMVVGEKVKSPEEIKLLSIANDWIKKIFSELGLEECFIPISDEQVHFLDDKAWLNIFPGEDRMYGFSQQIEQNVYIRIVENKIEEKASLYQFSALVHELLHIVGHTKYKNFQQSDGELSMYTYRTGYQLQTTEDNKRFQALNEALVDGFVKVILLSHSDEIRAEFGIQLDEENIDEYINYHQFTHFLGSLINQMSDVLKTDPVDIRDEIMKGYVTGNMMHLRAIEKVFGKGSIQLLSLLETHANAEIIISIFDYFSLETPEEKRQKIMKDLLGEI